MKHCPYCGVLIGDGGAFCSACGRHVFDVTAQSAPIYTASGAKRNTGRLVLACALGMVAAAAVVLVCIRAFSAPKRIGGFDAVYDTLLERVTVAGQDVTPAPQTTPEPTAEATAEAAALTAGAAIDLPGYAFGPISYAAARFVPQTFADKTQFMEALTGREWAFDQAYGNPDAVMFNGGYVDIGVYDDSVLNVNAFYDDYTASYSQLDPQNHSELFVFDFGYWTQLRGGTHIACFDTGLAAQSDGVMYSAVGMWFIDMDGGLVECLALYDIHSETFLEISNYNRYLPADLPAGQTDDPDHTAMAWPSRQAFLEALTGRTWEYARTDGRRPDIVTGEASMDDITPETLDRLTFYSNQTVRRTSLSADTMESLSEQTVECCIEDDHAYVRLGDYEYGDALYEVDLVFYIDTDGYLIESRELYSYEKGQYSTVSRNVNVFIPADP